MFFVDLKETKVNLVTAAVFAAFPTGSVQSTHLTQTVVFYLNLNANTNTNTNTNVNTNTNTNTNTKFKRILDGGGGYGWPVPRYAGIPASHPALLHSAYCIVHNHSSYCKVHSPYCILHSA